MTYAISKVKHQAICNYGITPRATRTKPIFDLDLHFDSSYTPTKSNVYISNDCNAVVLTRFC